MWLEWIDPKEDLPSIKMTFKDDSDDEDLYEIWESKNILAELTNGIVMARYYESYCIGEGEKSRTKGWEIYTEEGLECIDLKDVIAWMPLSRRCYGRFDNKTNDGDTVGEE